MRTETIISRALLCLAMNMPVGVTARANVNGDEAPRHAVQADADGADVPRFTALTLTGNDEDAPFRPAGRGLYRTYARLRRGTFRLTGTTAAGDVAPFCLLRDAKSVQNFVGRLSFSVWRFNKSLSKFPS